MKRLRLATIALAAAGLLCASCSSPSIRTNFESDALDTTPAGWEVAETNSGGKLARWRIESDDAGRFVTALTMNSGSTYNLLFSPLPKIRDGLVSVRMRADRGVEDQGGGLVWRALDANNYYIVRWNPLESNLRLYKVIDGVRTQLASTDQRFGDGWHRLDVNFEGRQFEISVDGREILAYADGTIASAGRVGLWTKADAVTSFDDFEARAR